jgi:homocitrate synthase NifV
MRDGEQMPGVSFTAEQKLKIAALLDDSGVHQIEAGVPASGKQEKEIIAKIIEKRKKAVISVWARMVESDIQHAIDVRPDIVHVSVPVSYLHIYAKLRKNKTWVIKQLHGCLKLMEKSGLRLSVGFEDAFRSEAAFMLQLARILLDFGVTRIRLSDTVGVADPTVCRTVIKDFHSQLDGKAQLGFHAHNDLGMAVANTVEAAKWDCIYADVTVGGIGERAGNCDLAQLVVASSSVFDWGLTGQEALRLQREIIEVVRPK